jgi:hypothetical protein
MHLIYLDESGNSGMNLNDAQQPVFVLCGLIVPEHKWLGLERELLASLRRHFPEFPDSHEVHATDIRSGRGYFKGVDIGKRIAFRDEWLALADRHGCKLIYRAIVKKSFQKWLLREYGSGVQINPYVAAFALVSQVINDYLRRLSPPGLGVLISDENKEVISEVEKSIRLLRNHAGQLRLGQIVEKGFFIDSRTSLPLQLCDLCALAIRKKEEAKIGPAIKPVDKTAIPFVDKLVHRGDESLLDVMKWLMDQQK